jgi:hypothetical protein
MDNQAKNNLTLILVVLTGMFGVWLLLLSQPQTIGQVFVTNASAVTVNTTINITNAAPYITSVALDTPIDLTAYNTTQVYCNVTTYDYDNDTLTVNATFYLNGTSLPTDPDDGNSKYTNTSCRRATNQNPSINWTCVFDVEYYANNNSNWLCEAIAIDTVSQFPTSNISNKGTINPLVALRMPAILDYGELTTGQTSNDTLANITNAGNRNINVSVRGYGASVGDNLSFDCTLGTIPIDLERYNTTSNSSFQYMYNLTGTDVMFRDFYVSQRTGAVDSMNLTYWKVYIPVGAGGVCNGKLVFTAQDMVG